MQGAIVEERYFLDGIIGGKQRWYDRRTGTRFTTVLSRDVNTEVREKRELCLCASKCRCKGDDCLNCKHPVFDDQTEACKKCEND